MKTLIKNGHIIDPSQKINEKKNLLIENGLIVDFINEVDADEIIDAQGCYVTPGFVDLHTHLREPGQEYKETIETGTRAAAAGGFTSVCCMANTDPVNHDSSVTRTIIKQAKEKGIVNVFPIGALTHNLEGKELSQIGDLKDAGCVALSDDGKCVQNSKLMRLAMEYAKSFGLPVITHSIDPVLSDGGVMNESALSTRMGLKGIPNEAEDIMIARDIYLASLTGAKLHVAHVATKGGVELISEAKKKGLPVTAEVSPHHLTLTENEVKGYNTHAKMAPPLRSEEDRLSVIKGLALGIIDCIATDHAPHATIDKEVEFDHACCGVVGLETALGLVYGLVEKKQLDLNRLIESLTIKPAQIVGLNKGTLKKGMEADVTIFNPNQSYVVTPEIFYTRSHNSPFMGMKLKARVVYTLVKGKTVYKLENK